MASRLSKPSPRSTLMRAYPAFSCRASLWAPWHRLPPLSPPWYHRRSLNEVRGMARCVESAQARARAAGACAPNPTPRARNSTPGVGMRGWEIHPAVSWPPLCSPKGNQMPVTFLELGQERSGCWIAGLVLGCLGRCGSQAQHTVNGHDWGYLLILCVRRLLQPLMKRVCEYEAALSSAYFKDFCGPNSELI